MDTNTLIMASLAGLAIWGVILVYLIETGSRSKEIERQMILQTTLLAKIAEKSGVDVEEIQKVIPKKTVDKTL